MPKLRKPVQLEVHPDEVIPLWGALVTRQLLAEDAAAAHQLRHLKDSAVLAQQLADIRHRLERVVNDAGGRI